MPHSFAAMFGAPLTRRQAEAAAALCFRTADHARTSRSHAASRLGARREALGAALREAGGTNLGATSAVDDADPFATLCLWATDEAAHTVRAFATLLLVTADEALAPASDHA